MPFCRIWIARVVLRLGIATCLALALLACNDKPTKPKPPAYTGADYIPAWSPDGKTIAYLSEDIIDSTGMPDLRIKTIDLGTHAESTVWHPVGGIGMWDLTWSPDSRWLLFAFEGGIAKMLANGDSLHLVVGGEFLYAPCWSPVTDTIYFTARIGPNAGVFSVGPWGGDPTIALEGLYGAVRCSSSSDSIIVSASKPVSGSECLVFGGLSGSPPTDTIICNLYAVRLLRLGKAQDFVIFLGTITIDGPYTIYFVSRLDGSARRIIDGSAFDLSPDDSTLVVAGTGLSRGLVLVNLHSGETCNLTRNSSSKDGCPKATP
jgi:hypothetical protein